MDFVPVRSRVLWPVLAVVLSEETRPKGFVVRNDTTRFGETSFWQDYQPQLVITIN